MDAALEKYYGPMDPEKKELLKSLQTLADQHYESVTKSWGQDYEYEADEFGMRYAAEVGWDHGGLYALIKILESIEGVNPERGWGTHPSATTRLARLNKIIEKEGWTSSANGNVQKKRFEHFVGLLDE